MKLSLLGLLALIFLSACRPSSVKKAPPELQKVEGELRVALISNSFCQKSLYEKYRNVKVEFISISGESPRTCKLLPRYRQEVLGHFILQRFLSELDAKRPVKLYAYDLIRKDGTTDREMWEIALGHLAPLNLHLIALSVGVEDPQKKMAPLVFPKNSSLLIHSDYKTKKKETIKATWPHHSVSEESFLMTTFEKKEDALDEGPQNIYFYNIRRRVFLPPTLRALAVGMARMINHCESGLLRGPKQLTKCIEEKATKIEGKYLHLPFKTQAP